jgi:hypothetical protein
MTSVLFPGFYLSLYILATNGENDEPYRDETMYRQPEQNPEIPITHISELFHNPLKLIVITRH